jgi:hypothetical protein
MAFFSPEEVSAMAIQEMVLHVVGEGEEFDPTSQMIIDPSYADFFLARIQDVAVDGVHTFKDESEVKRNLEMMAKGEKRFLDGCLDLSSRFSRDHVRASRPGAFFIFKISTDAPNKFVFVLIKYDYKQVIELHDREDGTRTLRQIVQAFIKEKRAIQKCCMARVVDGIAQAEISAFDRMGTASDLTDYFSKFLHCRRNRTNEQLNRDLNEALRASLQDCQPSLFPDGIGTAIATAKAALRNRAMIDEDAIREAIYIAANRPEAENVRADLERAVNRNLRSKKLLGLSFRPDPNILRLAARRLVKTAEGVELQFPGELEGRAVTKVVNGDVTTFTIVTTQTLVKDATVPNRTR